MKILIRLNFLIFFLITSSMFFSCKKDIENTDSNSQFIGIWEYLEYPSDDVVYMMRFEFHENGTFNSDSWEIAFGIDKPSIDDEGYGLNKEQATALIQSKSWNSYVSTGKWTIEDNYFESIKYSFVGGDLILPLGDLGENWVLTKK